MKETIIGKDRLAREYTEAEWFIGKDDIPDQMRMDIEEKNLRYGSILVKPDPFFSDLEAPISITIDRYKENSQLEAVETFSRIFNRDVIDDTHVEILMLVSVLARAMGGWKLKHSIEGWPAEWGNAVVLKIPKYGPVAWQYPDNCAPLFDRLPDFTGDFVEHDTGGKLHTLLSFVHFSDMGGLRG